MLPKTHTFNGCKYYLTFGDLDGNADTDDKYWIIIERDLTKKVGLETAIHESLHACNWHKSEEHVTQTAYDIARFLWNLGYRLNGS
jgi:hypothetical protein